MTSFIKELGTFFILSNTISKRGSRMNKINELMYLIECIDDLLTERIAYEKVQAQTEFNVRIIKAHQRVSLAEKKYPVKNTRSLKSSEIE